MPHTPLFVFYMVQETNRLFVVLKNLLSLTPVDLLHIQETYISLISAEYLCPGGELVRCIAPYPRHGLRVSTDVVHILIERYIVGRPVAST